MPSWNDILAEISATRDDPVQGSRFDQVRRKYLTALAAHTGRHTILYAARWLQGVPQGSESLVAVSDEDVQGLMSTVKDHASPNLDLILHSPGGSPEAAESIVHYLREKFTNVRVIVPHLAMSAATMIACSANQIVMGRQSSLGPTDPQLVLQTPLGVRAVPAQAILEQFKRAKSECRDPKLLRAWAPILPQYGPDLLVTCENASKLTRSLVKRWLNAYLLAELAARKRGQVVRRCATFLTSHNQHATHGRHLDREQLRKQGIAAIIDLEADPVLQDLVLSVYHATTICFSTLGHVAKLIENQLGRAFIKAAPIMPAGIPLPFGLPPGVRPVPLGPAPGPPPGGAPPTPAAPTPGAP